MSEWCKCKTCNHNAAEGICKALGDDGTCDAKCDGCYGVENCSKYQSKIEADLQFQTSRADGATIAMQELQAELDRLKPWAELGKLAVEITCSTLPPEISDEYCDKSCKFKQICFKRKELESAE